MTNKNESHKYIYVNPYALFTKETDLYNRKYNIKLKEKEKQQSSINARLEYNVKEIIKYLFKEGTIIYLGKASNPYVIKSYTFKKAVMDEDEDEDEKDIDKKDEKDRENIEDDVLHKKTIVMNTIKISYFNSNKTINTTINLSLYPGETLPAVNSPNFKSFDCLKKQHDVYKKLAVFSGMEIWNKPKKDNPFENAKTVMTTFIDDAVYKKYSENGNKEKNMESQNSSNKKTSTNKKTKGGTRKRRTKSGTRKRRTKSGTRK
jgi:hypothetical protein